MLNNPANTPAFGQAVRQLAVASGLSELSARDILRCCLNAFVTPDDMVYDDLNLCDNDEVEDYLHPHAAAS